MARAAAGSDAGDFYFVDIRRQSKCILTVAYTQAFIGPSLDAVSGGRIMDDVNGFGGERHIRWHAACAYGCNESSVCPSRNHKHILYSLNS